MPANPAAAATAEAEHAAAARGRRVMLAILPLVLMVPAVNLLQISRDGVPESLRQGDMNIAYVVGLACSVLLVVAWVLAWRGRRKPRLLLGWVYVLAAALIVGVPAVLWLGGAPLPPGWSFGLLFALIYGAGGWLLLVSPNVMAFQGRQRARRR